jgi:hypothetical protein
MVDIHSLSRNRRVFLQEGDLYMHIPTRQHNHVVKLLLLIEAGILPEGIEVDALQITHQDGCGFLQQPPEQTGN